MMRRAAVLFCMAWLVTACKSADVGAQDTDNSEETRQETAVSTKGKRNGKLTDEYLGIVYLPEHNVTLESGRLRVVLRGNTGTFNIYAVDAQGKRTAIFSTVDDSSTTFFSVLVGKREYRLNKAASIETQVRQTDAGGQIAYTLKKQFQSVLDFSLLSSERGGEADVVRLTLYVTNLAKNRQTLAVRAVLDTVLGENQSYHFETASHERIYGEKQFSALSGERFFYSGNGNTTAQVLVEGKTMQSPQMITFAHRDSLSSGAFFPVVRGEKSFTNIMTYSNSAAGINWPYFSVNPGETAHLTFYIAVGTGGVAPKGLQFVDALEDNAQIVAAVSDERRDVDAAVSEVSDDKLDFVYIQNLIDRINALNDDPKQVDRAEVRRLDAELDAILARIRQLNWQ